MATISDVQSKFLISDQKKLIRDNRGFRFNLEFQNYPKSIFEINNEKQNIIILGSSFGFGVGSTNDAKFNIRTLRKKTKIITS